MPSKRQAAARKLCKIAFPQYQNVSKARKWLKNQTFGSEGFAVNYLCPIFAAVNTFLVPATLPRRTRPGTARGFSPAKPCIGTAARTPARPQAAQSPSHQLNQTSGPPACGKAVRQVPAQSAPRPSPRPALRPDAPERQPARSPWHIPSHALCRFQPEGCNVWICATCA